EEGRVVGGRALRGGEGLVGGDGAGDDAQVGGAGGGEFAQGRLYGRQVAFGGGVLGGQRRAGREQFGQFAGRPVQDGHREGAGQGLAEGAQFRSQAGDLGLQLRRVLRAEGPHALGVVQFVQGDR